VTDVL